MKFKKGDLVVCQDNCYFAGTLVINQVYRVKNAINEGKLLILEGHKIAFGSDRFTLFLSDMPPQQVNLGQHVYH